MQLAFAMRFTAAAGLLGHPTLHGTVAGAGWALISIAIYVFNGLSDVGGDAANGSRRPIVTGRLTQHAARVAYRSAAAGGLVLCAACGGIALLVLAAAFGLLGWLYSAGPALKSSAVSAALTIGGGCSLTYAAGYVVSEGHQMDRLAALLTIGGWVALACSTKDFSDVVGDCAAGRKTLPVTLGHRPAARGLAVATTLLAAAFVAAEWGSSYSYVAISLLIGTLAMCVLLWTSKPDAPCRRRRMPYRGYMATQYMLNTLLLLLSI